MEASVCSQVINIGFAVNVEICKPKGMFSLGGFAVCSEFSKLLCAYY